MQKLKGKTALITGGNSGMGYATAQLFLLEGANVIITGRNENLVNEAVKSLGAGAQGIVSDASKMSDLNTLEKKVSALTPTLDTVFVNAGVGLFASFRDTTEELFDANADVNFKGAFFTAQKLLPILKQGSSIIFNTTILVHSGFTSASAYSASKAAVLSLTKTLAIELAEDNIRVNAISPGPINTPIYSKMNMPADLLQAFAESVQAKIPMQRFGEGEDIAKAALFLASADSSFITGSELTVDGGKSITF
jgi:NAD(P)-dependent dehydrogenase (short-subunit alcohol dehydrogenase family)